MSDDLTNEESAAFDRIFANKRELTLEGEWEAELRASIHGRATGPRSPEPIDGESDATVVPIAERRSAKPAAGRLLWLATAAALVTFAIGLAAVQGDGTPATDDTGTGTQPEGQDSIVTPPPVLVCSEPRVLLGDQITCVANELNGSGTLDWGDGSAQMIAAGESASKSFSAPGEQTLTLSDPLGSAVLHVDVIDPTAFQISCTSDGTETSYQLVSSQSDLGADWSYVRDEGGERVVAETVSDIVSCELVSTQPNTSSVERSWEVSPSGPAAVAGTRQGTGTFLDTPLDSESFVYVWEGGQPATLTYTASVGDLVFTESISIFVTGCGCRP